MVTVQPHFRKELKKIRKEFSRQGGKTLFTWLLRCCDSVADTSDLTGREAGQLGNLTQDGGIDKAIRRKSSTVSGGDF